MVNTVLDASIVTNSKALQRAFAPRSGRIHKLLAKNLRAWLRKSAGDWERRMKERQFVPYRGRSPKSALQARTGHLRSSMRFRMTGRGLGSAAVMFTPSPYARIQELGGKVRGNPYLAIPFSDTLVPSGSRVRSRYVSRKVGSGWQLPDGTPTFIHKTPGGALIVAAGINGRMKGLKLLKREVTIPKGRLGFLRTWRGLQTQRARDRRAAVLAALQGREWKA